MRKPANLTIGRLAAATGVNLETIRYYERIGLMAPPDRTEGADLVRLEAILGDTVSRCARSATAPSCPVLEMLERAA